MNFLKNISDWKKFPDTQTLGYYHPMGNYIYLSEYKNEGDLPIPFIVFGSSKGEKISLL